MIEQFYDKDGPNQGGLTSIVKMALMKNYACEEMVNEELTLQNFEDLISK